MFLFKSDEEKKAERLKELTYDNTPVFSFNGRIFLSKVLDVYDGDTCTILFEYNGEIMKYKCRCMGYDCAEMKPKKDDPTRDEQKKLAIAAKNRFIELIGGIDSIVQIKCLDFDKYGRLLADVYIDYDNPIIHLSDILLNENLAYKYDGGTKLSEEDQLKNTLH